MALDRVLSQEEIDKVFRNSRDTQPEEDPAKKAQSYDFRRPDRIAKDQLRAIHMLHENFARSLASSLSAYLRVYAIVNLVSVEQLSFMEFSQCLPSPTVITALAMRPFDGSAVLEMNPGFVFPVIEILLGRSGISSNVKMEREITEIEESILEGLYRIVLHDMREAWRSVTLFDFERQTTETDPQMLQILAPNEAVVAISMEVRIGEAVGLMNIGIPSIIIKMLRQKFDQQWSVRKAEITEAEVNRNMHLIRNSTIGMDVRLDGPTISTQDLLRLEPGDVLSLDFSVDKPLRLKMNGLHRCNGFIVERGFRRGFEIERFVNPAD
ncbi:MAG: flagellar motor switch protein FliM [Acidobacteria bacterium]|nr:flagellar motor switch protein FliM [Acidobacteriota bacterium]